MTKSVSYPKVQEYLRDGGALMPSLLLKGMDLRMACYTFPIFLFLVLSWELVQLD